MYCKRAQDNFKVRLFLLWLPLAMCHSLQSWKLAILSLVIRDIMKQLLLVLFLHNAPLQSKVHKYKPDEINLADLLVLKPF
jgi:hypothetical protein